LVFTPPSFRYFFLGNGALRSYREAKPDGDVSSETGLLVCSRPWPAMARTVWGHLSTFGSESWRGNLAAFAAAYYPRCTVDGVAARAFSLGDLAQLWADGSVSVIGRQHELMPGGGGADELRGEPSSRRASPVTPLYSGMYMYTHIYMCIYI